MGWNNVEVSCGFGGGEETKRFGPRQEIGSSLYQVDTVACINNKDSSLGAPNIHCHASNSSIAVAIEKNLLVFNDTCSEHICTFTTNSIIDTVAWSDDAKFIVFGNRSGSLSFAHIDSNQILFSRNLSEPESGKKSKKCFVSIEFFTQKSNDLSELIVVTSEGLGFRFQNIDLKNLSLAIDKKDLEEAQNIQAKIKMTTFNLTDIHEQVTSATYQCDDVNGTVALFTGCGENAISEWAMTEDSEMLTDFMQNLDPEIGFKKCLATPDDQYILVLDERKRLTLWSRFSYIYLSEWDVSCVEDFKLFITNTVDNQNNGKSKAVEETKVVLLTSPGKDMKSELVVLSLPHFVHVYTLKLSNCVSLAEMPSNQDTIVFLEGVEEENLDDSMDDNWRATGNIATVRIRCLMEAIPENRFFRILHKKKFDEAEEFAKMFGLDVQLVHKVRSHDILDRLSPWSTTGQPTSDVYDELIAELKTCLDKIEDMEHVVNCCLKAQLPTLNATSELLNYARQKVNFGERKFTKSSSLLQELLDGINRLITFEVAYGSHLFSGSTWNAFLTTSLLDEVIKSFSETKINSAIIIWRRHQSEFESEFTLQKLEQVLSSIPKITPSQKLIPWLREDFVPFVLTVNPDGQCLLADWLENTARRLEFSEKEKWPDNALDLAEVMYTAFSNVSQSTQDRGVATPMQFATKICKLSIPFFTDVAGKTEDEKDSKGSIEVNLAAAMKKLGNLVKSLREVKSLHYDYNCKLSLAQFTTEDTKAIAFKLLNRIAAAELIPQTMKKYVKPYVLKNNLKLDQVLYEYIADVVDMNTQLGVIWEPKIISIINEIEKKEVRCDATLKLMYKANRPWTKEVETLVMSELEKNPDNLKLNRQFQFAQLCKMLATYEIRDSNLADLSRIEAILKHMFSTDNPAALDDALKICQYYSSLTTSYVYSMRIKFWIVAGKLSECCDLLRSVPLSLVKKVAQYIITWIDNTIMWEPMDDEDRDTQMQLTEAAVLLLNTMANKDKLFKKEAMDYIRKLKSINRLQCEFGIFISITTYDDKDETLKILHQYYNDPSQYTSLDSSINNNVQKEQQPDANRLFRLAELIGFTIDEIESLVVDILKSKNQLQDIFDVARKIVKSLDNEKYIHANNNQIKLIWKIIYILMTTPNEECKFDWVKNIDDLHVFASIALSLCSASQLSDYLTLSRFIRIVSNVASQCETTDFQEDSRRVDGLLHQWIEDQYHDDSLVLPSTEVLPLLQKLFTLLIQDADPIHFQYECSRLVGKGLSYKVSESGSVVFDIVQFSKSLHVLVNMLQENNQHQLSMAALMLGVSTCAQHASTLQIGFPVMLTTEKELKEITLAESLVTTSDMIMKRGAAVIADKCTQLATTVLSHRIVDEDIALSYLLALPIEQGKQILNTLESKFHMKFVRAQSILKIGLTYGLLRSDKEFQLHSKEHRECAYWGRKFQLLRVDVGNTVRYDLHHNPDAVENIIQILIKHPNIDLQSITSFSESFNFDEEHALLNYIEYQLTNLEQATENYQENIDVAITMLSNTSNLNRILRYTSIFKISSFDYERLAYVYRKLAEISDDEKVLQACHSNLQLLEMLSLYERTSDQSEWDVDESIFAEESPDDHEAVLLDETNVPEHFKKRLPLHPLLDHKSKRTGKIITAELTCEKNTLKLGPIMTKLGLKKDQYFAKAIQIIAQKEVARVKANPAKMFDFSLVEKIFNHIDNYMCMMSVGRWLGKQMPKGPEKAKVVKRIVDKVTHILQSLDQETHTEIFVELKKSYMAMYRDHKYVATESYLIEHGVTNDKFFALCKDPVRLIYELYHEYGDKVKFETGRLTGVPDIDALAKKIAEMNDIVLQAELTKLVFHWLAHKRTLTDDEEEDNSLDSKSNKNEVLIENEKNLRRVIFALASKYNSTVIKHLIHFDEKHGSMPNVTKMTCIRAFQVLFTLVDAQVIQKETEQDMSIIYEKIVTLIYLAELEKLHVSYTEETFKKCNKEGLVKGLWRNHSHKAQGVRIIADICLDYKIFDPQLWNSLLTKLHNFNMISYMTHVLVLLSGVPALREIPSLVKMWRTVITSPFNSVSSPLTKEEERNCLQAAQLLTRCPVILDIGLEEIANLLKETGLYTKAMYCMKLIPNKEQREKNIQALIEDVGIEPLLAMVKKSRDQGVNDPQLDGVEEEIFNYIDENKLFVTLLDTAYFDRLVGHLVRSCKINNLLVKTIATGRLNNAVELIGFYLGEHPNCTTAKIVHESDMDTRHALLLYLQNEGLLNEVKPYLASLLKSSDTTLNLSTTSSEMSSPLMTSSFVN